MKDLDEQQNIIQNLSIQKKIILQKKIEQLDCKLENINGAEEQQVQQLNFG